MTGSELRQIIEKRSVSLAATAFAMGLSSPMALQGVLKSPDIKSGHLESAAKALGMTIPEMYAILGDTSPSDTQPQPEPQPAEASTASNDMQQVLLHLTALVTAQNQKIDDLSRQVADLSAALLAQRPPLPYDFESVPSPLQVADTSEIQ